MNEYHDTNLTYDSCKDCEKLMKEGLRLAKKINELHGLNSALEYANSQISEHNKAIMKDLKETREQLRKANCWLGFDAWLENNYHFEDYGEKYYKKKDGKTGPFQNGKILGQLRNEYAELNNL